MKRVTEEDWDVETSHFAERFQLFVIITLGETIVLIGATTAQLDLDLARAGAFGLAFLGAAALWWLYFDYVAQIAERHLELAERRTRLARDGYTYLHVLIVAGVVLTGVGDELVVAHPGDSLPADQVAAVAGGPALYPLAHVLFRLRLAGTLSRKRLGGALACAGAGLALAPALALALAATLVAILVAVIAAERISSRRRAAR